MPRRYNGSPIVVIDCGKINALQKRPFADRVIHCLCHFISNAIDDKDRNHRLIIPERETMDKIQSMTTFVAVVKAGSFIRAIESTGLSRAAVSRQVMELEQFLGVRLLHRTTRKISLTEEGHGFYLRCQDILAAIQEAENQVCSNASQAIGRLRIGTPQDFGVLQLGALWGKFMTQNPGVRLDIFLSDRNVDPVEEGYDLVVRIGHLSDSTLVARLLTTTRMVLCASPAYLSRNGSPSHPDELIHHSTLAYSYYGSGDEWKLRQAQGMELKVRVEPKIHVNNGATCRTLALAGHGIIFQPDFMMNSDLQKGALTEILPDWKGESMGIYAMYPTRNLLPLKVKLLCDFLADSLRIPPWCIDDDDPWARLSAAD